MALITIYIPDAEAFQIERQLQQSEVPMRWFFEHGLYYDLDPKALARRKSIFTNIAFDETVRKTPKH